MKNEKIDEKELKIVANIFKTYPKLLKTITEIMRKEDFDEFAEKNNIDVDEITGLMMEGIVQMATVASLNFKHFKNQ